MDTDNVGGQSERLKQSAEVQKAVEETMRWLGAAVHDLVHPVGAVLTYSEMLIEDDSKELGVEQRTLVESIHSSAESMLKLLNDLAEFSALESPGLQLALEPVDIRALIQESISLNLPSAARKGTRLSVQCAARVPSMSLDRGRMLALFNNLLENAIKYCQDGANVSVLVSRERNDLTISVSDNGPGIPHDEFERLFVPFQKTRARAANNRLGTGLGLAICKRTVERHGGRIWAETRPGAGTTFFLSLPISRN